jgi:hypothetical protein
MRAANAGGGLRVCGRAAEMVAYVADEVGSDAPLHETPGPVAPLEAVVVPPTDDGLERSSA